ncbi:hypothetical protein ONE63_001843 [Megalurothrips usitatus]|uniref:Uncharacterized protein n=1 Tax=Megalurothrips usitatus TaxID=439358 RepID=A0AAV7XDV0_9NEOP|nr:hypothetical protein ONE63_001843 [Megalurothrips usitatus]
MKYEISVRFKVVMCYEGEEVADNSTMMDVAYQFFYEARSPMRFTYRITPAGPARAPVARTAVAEQAPAPPPAAPAAPAPQPAQTPAALAAASMPLPVVLVTPIATVAPTVVPQMASCPTPRSRGSGLSPRLTGSGGSAGSSSDESSSARRQQRQRSAKTAAYSAIGAMEEESDHEDAEQPKRRRLSAKSPRWEADEYTPVYRSTRRTPKTSLEDFEARYNARPGARRVYAPCTDDELSSDAETRRNTLANQKSSAKYQNLLNLLRTDGHKPTFKKRGKKDVYEFSVQNEDNEDSNTTQEFDFVYDNSDPESAESERNQEAGADQDAAYENGHSAEVSEADERELEQHIEMEVVTDTEDIDQHIEDSIEEVEVDADDEAAMEGDHHMEADTTSSASLVIAEDEDDDGVVEELLAAEEEGQELVVVEEPEEDVATYTVEVQDAAAGKHSSSSKSPTVEEDEPEIVHEKVVRKKSKKSKHHHHHHHHHKRKRHHSPVMLISSPEEAPMKLTLKLRPTPSISPGSSSRKSPLPDSPTKEKRISISLNSDSNGPQKTYTVKINPPKAPSPPTVYEIKADNSSKASSAKTPPPKPKTPEEAVQSNGQVGDDRGAKMAADKRGAEQSPEVKSVSDDAKERLAQMRQVRIKPVIDASEARQNTPDLTTVKTPSSLTISKIEVGESPQRAGEPSGKPSLEILVLPPSPPPSDKHDESEDCSSSSEPPAKKKKADDVQAAAKPAAPREAEQGGVLDLSADRSRRDATPPTPSPLTPATSPSYKMELPPQIQYVQPVPPTPMQLQQMQLVAANPQIRSIHQMMGEATIATMKRMSSAMGNPLLTGKMPVLSLYRDPLMTPMVNVMSTPPRGRPMGAVVGGFAAPPQAASSRPGPNQSVRQIPNPSALLHRQKSSLHQADKDFAVKQQQGQLTEQQLKERYQQFQQNRAAKAAFTYSRAAPAPARAPPIPSSAAIPAATTSIMSANAAAAKAAFRPRSIEKVAGLLSVRAGALQ